MDLRESMLGIGSAWFVLAVLPCAALGVAGRSRKTAWETEVRKGLLPFRCGDRNHKIFRALGTASPFCVVAGDPFCYSLTCSHIIFAFKMGLLKLKPIKVVLSRAHFNNSLCGCRQV